MILDRSAGNKREACRVLGISYHTLQAYLRYPIHDPTVVSDEAWQVDAEADVPVMGPPGAPQVEPAPEEEGPVTCAASDVS